MNKERDPYQIAKMPSKETLQEFLRGMSSKPTVVFNSKTGKFEPVNKESNAKG